MLESITLAEAVKLTDATLHNIASSKLPHTLRSISLCSCPFSNEGIKSLSKLRNLKEFTVTDCEVNDAFKLVVNNTSDLEILRVSRTQFNDSTLIEIAPKLKALKVLVVDATQVAATWIDISKQFSKLEEFDASGTRISDEILTNIIQKNFNSLKFLQIRSCKQLTAVSIALVPQHCHNLEKLALNELPITTEIVISIATNCPKLTFLDISYTKVTDQAVEAIAKNLKLTKLYLHSCNITSAVKKMFDPKITQVYG